MTKYYIIAVVASLFMSIILLVFRKKVEEKNKIIKAIAIIYMLVYFVRFFMYDGVYNLDRNKDEVFFLISRWIYHAVLLIFPMAAFSNVRIFKKLAVYVGLPIVIIAIMYMTKSFQYFTDYKDYAIINDQGVLIGGGEGLYSFRALKNSFENIPDTFRYIQYTLELSVAFILGLSILFYKINELKVENKKDFGKMVLALLLLMILMIPHYTWNALFGHSYIEVKSIKAILIVHITTICAGVLLHFGLAKKDKRTQYAILTGIAFAVMIQFCTRYVEGYSLKSLPLQLCNLGCYLMVLSLIMKWRALFYFTFLINVPGAIIALTVPNVDTTLLTSAFFHYYHEHIFVVIVPILCITLGLYEKPKEKDIKKALIFYAIYFFTCLILGTWLVNYDNGVNYFYLIKDTVSEYFMFFALLKRNVFSFTVFNTKFILYPAYQATIGISFLAIAYIVYWVYKRIDSLIYEYKKINKENKEIWISSNNVEALTKDRTIKKSVSIFASIIIALYFIIVFIVL